jgi:hypothetical protein
MQDLAKCPIPPLDISLLRQLQRRRHAAQDLHRGWCAARAGLPQDASEGEAWRAGHQLWRDLELTRAICEMRQAHAATATSRPGRPQLAIVR